MTSKPLNDISDLVSGRLPEFIRVDHPTLVAFLDAYYEWLQNKDRSGKILSPMVLQDVIDVDDTLNDFVKQFKNQYLYNFPEKLATSKDGTPLDIRKLMKHIKAFYRSKGTEKSYEFLFRILYDASVEIYYPKQDILRVSDAKWYQKTSIKSSNSLGDRIFDSIGRIIYQKNIEGKITSSAKVIDVNLYQQDQYEVAELVLTGKNGSFSPGSRGFSFEVDNQVLRELKIYDVVTSVTVSNGGSGYTVGDRVIFTAVAGDSGIAARGQVSVVSATGSIKRIKMDDFGLNYGVSPSITVQSINGSGFSGVANLGALCESEGYYVNTDGRLSSKKVIQDNHYYQDFSYVLKTELVIDEYREAVRRLIHPAGTAMFGQVLIKRCAKEDLTNASTLMRFERPIIGHYCPYTFNTYNNLQEWFSIPGTGDSLGTNIPSGYNPNKHDSLIQYGGKAGTPDQLTTIGNPITNLIPFVEATGPSFSPLGLSGYQNADPFWIIYEHPNRKISGPTIAQIWRNQLSDFVNTWPEWCSVTGGGPPNGWTADFQDPSFEKKYAFLKYNDTSSFRKITARAFFEMPIGEEFDCKVESREAFARPVMNILQPLNGQEVNSKIESCPITIRFDIQNSQNLPRVSGFDQDSKIRISMSPNTVPSLKKPVYLDINEREFHANSVPEGIYSVRVDVVDRLFRPIQRLSDSVVFEYTCLPPNP